MERGARSFMDVIGDYYCSLLLFENRILDYLKMYTGGHEDKRSRDRLS